MAAVEISKKLAGVNALTLLASRIISIGLLVWVNQYLINRLDPDEYASYPVVVAAVLFLQSVPIGLSAGIARYVTEAYAKGDRRGVTEIISSMMPVVAGVTLLFMGAGAVLAWKVDVALNIAPAYASEARLMMVLLVLSNGLRLLGTPFLVGMFVRQKFTWVAIIGLAVQLLQLTILLVLLFAVSTRVLWWVVATVTSTTLGTAVTFVLSRRLIPELRFEMKAFRASTAKKVSTFGAWTLLGVFLYRIRTSIDVILLQRFSSGTEVTAFHLGTLPDRQLDIIVATTSVAIEPALTAMHATNQDDSLRRAYLKGNRYYLWIALAVATPLVVFSKELVALYVVSTFSMAAAVLVLISARYPLSFASEMLYKIAMAKAQVRAYYLAVSLFAAIKVVLAVLFIWKLQMGAVGAAWGYFLATLFIQVWLWPMGLRMLDLTFRRLWQETLRPGYIPAAVAALACLGLRVVLPPDSWFIMGIDVALGLLVYVLVMYLVAKEDDRADASRIWQRLTSLLTRKSTTSEVGL